MKTYQQEPPFAIQVELSEGCNLFCDFCGLQGIREFKPKVFKFMTPETAMRIADEILRLEWNPRIEFAMHGEPTWNTEFIRIVKIFRRRLPHQQLMMTSNGGGLLRPPGPVENLRRLFDAGLNVFAFDAYEYVKIKDHVMPAIESEKDRGFEVFYYPDNKAASPHNRWGPKARVFIRVQDISKADEGTHSELNNHCGAGSPPNKDGHGKRCAKPFRELSFRWDGNVALCCNDWRGVYKCGNILETPLDELWNSSAFQSARKFLIRGDRKSLSPCDVCDARSYRVGLLPDKKGKIKLPEPTAEDHKIAKLAASGDPYTKPVFRPWEKTSVP